jgi:hypothetical protein
MNEIKPKTWQSGASLILDSCYDILTSGNSYSMVDQESCLEFIIKELDDIVESVFHGNQDYELLEEQFFDLAIAAIMGLSYTADITNKKSIRIIFDTLIAKQKMYGHQNIARFGLPGVVIRLNDKLERIKNLRQHKGPVLFEPIQDTWLDITGYSVIAIMWIRDWFLLELKAPKETTSQI